MYETIIHFVFHDGHQMKMSIGLHSTEIGAQRQAKEHGAHMERADKISGFAELLGISRLGVAVRSIGVDGPVSDIIVPKRMLQ